MNAANLYCVNPVIDHNVDRLLRLSDWLRDRDVQEISINSRGQVYVDYGTDAMRNTGIVLPDTSIRAGIRLLTAANGAYLDPDAPFATLTLACGARFHGALAPVSDEPQISIRTHRRILRPLSQFMSEQFIELVREAVGARKSIMIGGATSAGKTTLLNSLLNLIPAEQRLVIIEDAPEIQIEPGRNVVRRLATGRADLRRHVFESLRDRPDWLCIGETRDHAARDVLDAARTGHPGISTVHASSAEGIITRLMSLAKCDFQFVKEAIDLVLFIERMPDGRRAVTQIKEIEK